ncbi:MAG: hypothetical protein GX432_00260 [Candidatus Atribacteria bacterium]|nr:hypothetical protein [Candidatus Atribacteria bacterium]
MRAIQSPNSIGDVKSLDPQEIEAEHAEFFAYDDKYDELMKKIVEDEQLQKIASKCASIEQIADFVVKALREQHVTGRLALIFTPHILHHFHGGSWTEDREKLLDAAFKALRRADDLAACDYTSVEHWIKTSARALQVLKFGDPVDYVVKACSRQCLGAESAFLKLIACVSMQNVRQTNGLHIKISGESGSGKTHAIYTFSHHLPQEMVIAGSMSSLAAFYHDDGDRLLRVLDDYTGGNETLDTVIKQTSSKFHSRFKHRTVDIQRKKLVLEVGSEQTWVITSVDASQDIQILTRQIPINIDDSCELTQKINKRILERYGRGETTYGVDDITLTCREIFRIMRDEPLIDAKIPFYERIEWLDNTNRRNLPLFLDIILANAGMYRYQREQDSDGYYLATEADFHTAVSMFSDTNARTEILMRFTKKEIEVLKILIACGALSHSEIADRMQPKVTARRVRDIIHGRKGSGGLEQKVNISIEKLSEPYETHEGRIMYKQKTLLSLVNVQSVGAILFGCEVARLLPPMVEPCGTSVEPHLEHSLEHRNQ